MIRLVDTETHEVIITNEKSLFSLLTRKYDELIKIYSDGHMNYRCYRQLSSFRNMMFVIKRTDAQSILVNPFVYNIIYNSLEAKYTD